VGSVATGIREGNVTGFPAIRAVVQTVGTEVHLVLPFANDAVLIARAVRLGLVALHADRGTGHGSLRGKLYLSMGGGGKAELAQEE
jgi:hypothetical protein